MPRFPRHGGSETDRNRSGDGDTDQGDLGILLADWGCDDPVNGCAGEYQAEVTNITHGVYDYTPEMDVDNPDYFSI